MSPTDLVARFVGLLIAVAGGFLAWSGLLAPTTGAPDVELLARGDVGTVVGILGVAFVLAGAAVFVDRGRPIVVSVGGVALVVAVGLIAVGSHTPVNALGIGTVAAAAFLAGASVGVRSV
ncbi:MAG: hypothetical protein ABEI27_02445 [Halobellus sp.]|uniref:hypothetical protein n=1 Tax=Halobellus sp. TaxID=1979212 RepID=UPI0035D4D126